MSKLVAFRMPDELHRLLVASAEYKGQTVSEVLVEAMRFWLKGALPQRPRRRALPESVMAAIGFDLEGKPITARKPYQKTGKRK